jgi:hypothetical protein
MTGGEYTVKKCPANSRNIIIDANPKFRVHEFSNSQIILAGLSVIQCSEAQ